MRRGRNGSPLFGAGEPHIPWAALWGPMAAMPAIRRLLGAKARQRGPKNGI